MVIQTPERDKIECMIGLDFPTTNNEVEYEALIAGLDLAKAAGAENMIIHCDSQVITSQINGDYECRNERMKKYLEEVKGRTYTSPQSGRTPPRVNDSPQSERTNPGSNLYKSTKWTDPTKGQQ